MGDLSAVRACPEDVPDVRGQVNGCPLMHYVSLKVYGRDYPRQQKKNTQNAGIYHSDITNHYANKLIHACMCVVFNVCVLVVSGVQSGVHPCGAKGANGEVSLAFSALNTFGLSA